MRRTSETPKDPRRALQGFVFFEGLVRLLIWAGSMAITLPLVARLDVWPDSWAAAAQWRQIGPTVLGLGLAVLLFNTFYVAFLLVLRLPIPTPKEGSYTITPGKPIDRQLMWSCLIAALTKARYEAPFPAFLVFQVSVLPPLRWFMGRVFGPRSKSCYISDVLFLDPYGIEVGRNVLLGYGAIIAAHIQNRDEVVIKKTVIEDDAIVGGNAIVYGGCTIKRGGVILGGAILLPNTIVGEYEVWGGVPAKKIKTLPPQGEIGEERGDANTDKPAADVPDQARAPQ